MFAIETKTCARRSRDAVESGIHARYIVAMKVFFGICLSNRKCVVFIVDKCFDLHNRKYFETLNSDICTVCSSALCVSLFLCFILNR